MELTPKARLMRDWMLSEWTEKLCLILESMADERPKAERRGAAMDATGPAPEAMIWKQSFAIFPDPVVWVGIPAATSIDLGRRTLRAAGVDSMDEADAQNTFLEILNQSLSALGQSMGAHLGCDAAATEGEQTSELPEGMEWNAVRLDFADGSLEPLWMVCEPELLERLAAGVEAPIEQKATVALSAPEIAETAEMEAIPVGGSKTFDLLLDVALPVSISFGRTFLPIKDVLKLSTGSIVELDRAVNEPVDVIVNNCIIARGEVVVVEGNYGVRIHQIASRHDRLRTGSSAAQVKHVLAGD